MTEYQQAKLTLAFISGFLLGVFVIYFALGLSGRLS